MDVRRAGAELTVGDAPGFESARGSWSVAGACEAKLEQVELAAARMDSECSFAKGLSKFLDLEEEAVDSLEWIEVSCDLRTAFHQREAQDAVQVTYAACFEQRFRA